MKLQHLLENREVQELLYWIDQQAATMQSLLLEWTSMNSGSLNWQGVNRFAELVADELKSIPTQQQRIHTNPWSRLGFDGQHQPQQLGDIWLFKSRPTAPFQLLLTGHLDTVFPIDCDFQTARFINDNRLNAPGASDMKGGLIVMLTALKALEQFSNKQQLGWTVLLNPDEEIGSPISAPYLEEQAKQHHLGLIFEPALPDGNLAGERKGSGNFTLAIYGKAAHAGRNPEQGRNSICLMAEAVQQLYQLNAQRPGLTLNPGILHAGESTNTVPGLAVMKFNIRVSSAEDISWCQQQLQQIVTTLNKKQGYRVALDGQFGRYPKRFDNKHKNLYQNVAKLAQLLGFNLNWQATGGCCDGNNLSAAGLANIDTLGVRGGYIHSNQEFIDLDSLTERCKLTTLILIAATESGHSLLEEVSI